MIAFTISSQAQQLNTTWERTARTGAAEAAPSWFSAGYVRGIAQGTVNGNVRVYAADRTNSTIRVLDAETGADVTLTTAFDLSQVAGGTYPMNDIEISDDGVIFLGNLTVDAEASPFRLYWWTSEGGSFADSLTLSVPGRLGDKFTVIGSVTDNTVEIWMPAAGSDPGIVYVATTTDQGASWDIETITLSGTVSNIASNADAAPIALGRESDFYVGGNGMSPARFDKDGVYIENSLISGSSRNGMQAFSANGTDHLAVYSYRPDGVNTGNKTGQVYVYDISDAANPTIVGESPLMGDDADTYSSIHGEAEVSVNEDGTYNVYSLEGVNGLALFTNAEPPYYDDPSNLFFSEYIEGSSNNKALEITNNTDSTVYLSNYQIAQSNNGDDWEYYFSFAEGASIAAGETYVLITDQVESTLFAAEDADEVLGYPSPIHFNGNDARAIIHIDAETGDTTFTDIFGDPNSSSDWDVAGVYEASTGYTLQRKPTVTEGNTTVLGSFGTNYDDSEWIVKSENVFNNLGLATEAMGALSGDYFIPQRSTDAEGFISLHQAFHYVNTEGLTANSNLMITADLDESFDSLTIDRDDLTESTALTIKPAAGVSPTVEVQGGPGGDGIWIKGTDYVTIDGSNEPGGSTRDLTLTSSDTTFSAMIYANESMNTTIANTNITYTGGDGASAIVADGGAASTENLTVHNNVIGSVNGDFDNGVGSWGTSSFPAMNTTVSGNEIYASYRGITTWYSNGNEFIGNKIIVSSPAENKSRYAGIYLAINLGTTNIIGNEISGLSVNRTAAAGAGYSAGVLFNASIGTVNVINNTISAENFNNAGDASGNNVFGIAFDNAAGNSTNAIYHNTVLISSSDETGIHAAFGSQGQTSTGQIWDLKNNIFSVEQDADNAHAIYWPIASADNLEADYNNYYVSGSSANLGYFNASATVALSNWQTASGNDMNTTNVSVEFTSDTDLRLAGASVGDEDLAGIPLATVTDDIDGNERSATAPYKGAFEADVALSAPEAPQIGAFALTSPADDFDLALTGDSTTVFEFSWAAPTANMEVQYTFHLDSVNGDFSSPLFSAPSDSNGFKTTSTPTYADIDSVMAELGVATGGSIDLKWTVTATAEDSTRFADAAHTISISRLLGVSNEEVSETPKEFSLSQNYPNPFNPTSYIQFTLPQTAEVRLEVFNITGQLVSTLVSGKMSAGEHTVQFNAGNLASGVYIYRIRAGNFVQTKKMTLIK